MEEKPDAARRVVRAGELSGGSPRLAGQHDTFRDHSRVPGLDELVTAFDFEPVAYASFRGKRTITPRKGSTASSRCAEIGKRLNGSRSYPEASSM